MRVKVKKLENFPKDWKLPQYATDGSACFDLRAIVLDYPSSTPTQMYLGREDFEESSYTTQIVFETGLAFEIPEGHVMLIYSRSGMGFRDGVRLSNCVGVIDSDYREEVKIALTMDGAATGRCKVKHGDRIAQAMIIPIPKIEFEEVQELGNTDRTGGFGSTGV